ncbi:YraN family protein [Zhouia amylolytica]|uniref:YraN family protein n=1 Tax=Zhouia amylolytica TaxID=376730 RepID=UPI0020CBD50D|nr:YraN family protein [Zhouia amylolytica]MCQ0110251.1 YraN family protein [Zhouia amylolytica]
MATHNDLGKKGEQLAAEYLSKKGYEVLERNYRFQKAEIDLIAIKENTLCVIEVKARSTNVFQNPEDAITQKKIKLLVKAIDNYVYENDLDVEVRFDIITILKTSESLTIQHFEDAFYHF